MAWGKNEAKVKLMALFSDSGTEPGFDEVNSTSAVHVFNITSKKNILKIGVDVNTGALLIQK